MVLEKSALSTVPQSLPSSDVQALPSRVFLRSKIFKLPKFNFSFEVAYLNLPQSNEPLYRKFSISADMQYGKLRS